MRSLFCSRLFLARKRPLALALALTASLLASPAVATTLRGDSPTRGDAVGSAKTFIMNQLGAFGVEHAALIFDSRTPVPRGEVLRFRQHIGEIPVLGAGISVLVQNGRIVLATGRLAAIDRVTSPIAISRQQAMAVALRHNSSSRIAAAQLVLLSHRRPGHPVWALDTTTYRPLGSWRLLIDATSGAFLRGRSKLRYADDPVYRSAKGFAYRPNPTVGKLEEVTLPRLTDPTKLSGVYATVQRCGYSDTGLECTNLATADQSNGDRYDYQPDEPTIDDAFAEVNAYYHVDIFSDWLKESFGYSRADGSPLEVFVNFHQIQNGRAQGMANAFFGDVTGDNKGDLVFGQARRDFSYDGDVVYHEYSHSVVDQTSGLEPGFDELGINGMPAALNEAFADLLSSAFAGDPQVGEYAGGSYGSGSIRDLNAANLKCPQDLSGESHQDGEIWGRLLWKIRQQASDKVAFDQLLYTTMATLQSNAGFDDAAAVLSAQLDLSDDDKLKAAATREMEQVNVGSTCTRIIDLGEIGGMHRGYVFGTDVLTGGSYVPAGLQYKVTVPANAGAMKVALTALTGRGAADGYIGAFIRKGDPVTFRGGQTPLNDIVQDNKTPLLIVDGASSPKLEAGATYYFLPLNVAGSDLGYEIKVRFEEQAAPMADLGVAASPDAGAPAPTADQGNDTKPTGGDSSSASTKPGSGCSLADPSSSSADLGWPLLLLLGLALAARRRSVR